MIELKETAGSSAGSSFADWRSANAEWLGLALERLRLRLGRRACWLERLPPGQRRGADWLLSERDATAEREFYNTDGAAVALDVAIKALERQLKQCEERMRTASRPPAVRGLAELAGLCPFEEDLLLLALAPSLDGAFAHAYAELYDDARRPYATLQLASAAFMDDTESRMLAADYLTATRPLRALHLIRADDDGSASILTRPLEVDERIADYARGLNQIDPRLSLLLSMLPRPTPTEATLRSAERVALAIVDQPNQWITVNLMGLAEDGASDVAALACASLGLELRRLDVARLAQYPPAERTLLISLLGREALLGGLAILIDMAGLERSATGHAADEVIAHVAATTFVVSAERWPAVRNACIERVNRATRPEQREIWKAALGPRAHSLEDEITAIVQQFDFGPPAIAEAVARAERRLDGPLSGRDLWRACREQCGSALEELARRIVPGHSWDDIILAGDTRLQLEELTSQVEQRGRVYEGWGFGARLTQGRGITALFAGPSGTGKTMAAEIVASQLDLELYSIDLAGLVSKYIGDTEKNLRRVFDAAERSGAILFFDEADALFGSRTEVRDSHDRYANIEVNYLLQRMEQYTGLAILATNRRSALDGAFLRRLRFVIEFPFPSADQRRRIWERIFPPLAEMEDFDSSFLSRLELSGGNIRSIAINAAFLAAADSSAICMQHIVQAAAREYTKLSRPVSAQEFGDYYAVVRE